MVTFKIRDFFYPRRLLYWYSLLWKSQYWPVGKMRQFQWDHLLKLHQHCLENVPYYRNLLKNRELIQSDFMSNGILSNIPVMDKYILLKNHSSIRAENFNKFKPKEVRTTGTTGTPMVVYWDRNSNVLELLCQYRHFTWAGYRLGQPFLDIRSIVFDDPNGFLWNWKCQGLEMSSDRININNIHYYADIIRKYRIGLWRGHPASLNKLSHLLADARIDDITPKAIISVSVALLNYQRSFIESWAGIPICDNYGLNEHNALITQCPSGGYHINSEYGIIEILNHNGSPAKPGEEGRIIATGLHNKAFPLLRYDTGDLAVPSDRMCPCGRTLPLIERFTGRIDDRILNDRGEWISGMSFPFYHLRGIRKAQLIQSRPKTLDVYIIPDTGYRQKIKDELIRELKKKLGQGMRIRIHEVKEVPCQTAGKYKFVVCHIEQKMLTDEIV